MINFQPILILLSIIFFYKNKSFYIILKFFRLDLTNKTKIIKKNFIIIYLKLKKNL